MLNGDRDGKGAFLAVGMRWCIDAEVVAAGADNGADRCRRVAPVDGGGVVPVGGGREGIAGVRLGPAVVRERGDAGDGRGRAALVDRLGGDGRSQRRDLHLVDGDV